MTTETYTGGTIKVSLPSNYAENRRGAEATLHYALPEGTTCEQAATAHDRVAAEALRVATSIVSGVVQPAIVPSEPAKPRKAKPSEITIPASSTAPAGTSEAPPFTPAVVTVPAQPSFAPPTQPAVPASTGTEAPAYSPPTVAAAAGPTLPTAAASAPAVVSTAASTAEQSEGGISNAELGKFIALQMVRLASIPGVEGRNGTVIRDIQAPFLGGDRSRSYTGIAQEDRRMFMDLVEAWRPQ